MSENRRTQAQRRAATQKQLLECACQLFGDRGYADTSLEDIAAECDVTIRPIYHYFGNKQGLFAAVNAVMEARILDVMASAAINADATSGIVENWKAFLDLCDDARFRRIVLIDSPNILGRARWADSEVSAKARGLFDQKQVKSKKEQYRNVLLQRIVMAAFAEAALVIAEAEDVETARQEAQILVKELFGRL